jgi:hypothetical protein
MADYNKQLSELHHRVVQDKLGISATIDEYGWVHFMHSELGEMQISLREYNPEHMILDCTFEDYATRSREDLMQICNSVNETSGEVAHLRLSNTGSYVHASVHLLLAAPGRIPDESLLRELISPAVSSIKAVAAQLADELPRFEAARKIVNDHLSSAYRSGMTADALFESYTSSPAFAEDRRLVSNAMGDAFPAYGYARQRCNEMCPPGGSPSGDG